MKKQLHCLPHVDIYSTSLANNIYNKRNESALCSTNGQMGIMSFSPASPNIPSSSQPFHPSALASHEANEKPSPKRQEMDGEQRATVFKKDGVKIEWCLVIGLSRMVILARFLWQLQTSRCNSRSRPNSSRRRSSSRPCASCKAWSSCYISSFAKDQNMDLQTRKN